MDVYWQFIQILLFLITNLPDTDGNQHRVKYVDGAGEELTARLIDGKRI